MFRSNPPYAIWSIWHHLPVIEKLFFLALCVLGIYSLYFAAVTMKRLGTISSTPHSQGVAALRIGLATLRSRTSKLRQWIGAAFYLFGVVLFMGFQSAYSTIDNSRTPVGWLVLGNFVIYFAFAANVFFVFLLLHFGQWFVSGRVDACTLRLNAAHEDI